MDYTKSFIKLNNQYFPNNFYDFSPDTNASDLKSR